jgi:GntR family transcriptional regulator
MHMTATRIIFEGRQRPAIVAEELRERLLAGEWSPGTRLPSEAALATHYGVSRGTIRTALIRLEGAGFIRIRHGKGSFVTNLLPSIKASLHELRSMTATIANAGHQPEMVYRRQELRLPTGEERERLEIPATIPVLYLERSILADSQVVAFDYDVINAELLPHDFDPGTLSGSLYSYLETVDLLPQRAVADVRPILSEEVGWGDGRSSTGLYLLLDELQFLNTDEILLWSRAYFVEDRFNFTLLRRR